MSSNSVSIRPQFDTHHEGVQTCMDVLHDRRSALNAMFNDAAERHDNDTMYKLSIRLEELAGLMSAIRVRAAR